MSIVCTALDLDLGKTLSSGAHRLFVYSLTGQHPLGQQHVLLGHLENCPHDCTAGAWPLTWP